MRRATASPLPRAALPRSETRRRIVEAALSLFARRGFDATTTAELARQAGVTEKTLFSHFRSKQQLYAEVAGPALLATVEPLVLDRLRQALATTHPTFAEAVRAIAQERLSFARGAPEVLKLVAQEVLLREEFREPLLAHWRRKVLPPALRLIAQARARGELRELPDQTVLRALVSLVLSLALEVVVLSPRKAARADAELDRLLDVFLHGVLHRPSRPQGPPRRGTPTVGRPGASR